MNTAPEPLTPDAVDELLSAELDGDLDGAARDLGLMPSDALARLAATPGVDARRLALTRARDLIAARPPLDLPVEDRLVLTATARDDLSAVRERRGRVERQWRVLVAAGSVAAAIAVVVGVSTMQHHDSSKASTAPTIQHSGAAKGAATAPVSRADFGDVTRDAALRAPARRLLSNLPSADSATGNGATPTPETQTTPSELNNQQKTASGSAFSAAAPACTPTALQRYNVAGRPVAVATGTVSGVPVAILIFDGPGTPFAYVVRVSDCSLVRRQSLR